MSPLASQNARIAPESRQSSWRSGGCSSARHGRSTRAEHHTPIPRHAGFSLIEAIIATGLLATLVVGVGQVFLVSSRAIHVARVRTLAAILAAQKMEQLRSLSWAHAPGGGLLSDTTNLSASLRPGTDQDSSPAPAGSLDTDMPSYVDYANAAAPGLPPRRRCVRAALVGRAARIRPAEPAGARRPCGHSRRRRCTSHQHQGASPMIPATSRRDLPRPRTPDE